MRILLVASMVPDRDGVGAIPKLLHAQLEGLRRRHEVTLLAPYGEDPGQAEAAAALASDPDSHLVDRRRSPDPLRRWRIRGELAARWARGEWPWRVVLGAGGMQPVLDRLLGEGEFDVIAVEDNPVGVLRFPAEVATVLTEHEAVRAAATEWRSGSGPAERSLGLLRERDWRRWEKFLPRLWSRFDLLQVFTEGDARDVRERSPALAERVRINPYGMDLPPLSDPAREEPATILFTGTMAHLPNRDAARWLAREIMPELTRTRPEAKLRIVGHRPPAETMALAGPNVEIVADAASVEPYLEAAAVVLAPVRSGGGMRMKVLEALGRGKAVVSTSLGAEGFSEFGPPPLRLADSATEIAAAIAALLEDVEERRRLGTQARELIRRHYTPEPWAARLASVYEEAREGAGKSAPRNQLSATGRRYPPG